MAYPLRIQARQPTKYFRQREQWRASDVLMNPMILMMIVAFGLMVITPKLVANDPQLQKELQQGVQMPNMDAPDIADMLANFWGGGAKKPAQNKQKPQISGQRRQR